MGTLRDWLSLAVGGVSKGFSPWFVHQSRWNEKPYFSDWQKKLSSGQQLPLCGTAKQAYLLGTQRDGATRVTAEILLFFTIHFSISEKDKKERTLYRLFLIYMDLFNTVVTHNFHTQFIHNFFSLFMTALLDECITARYLTEFMPHITAWSLKGLHKHLGTSLVCAKWHSKSFFIKLTSWNKILMGARGRKWKWYGSSCYLQNDWKVTKHYFLSMIWQDI